MTSLRRKEVVFEMNPPDRQLNFGWLSRPPIPPRMLAFSGKIRLFLVRRRSNLPHVGRQAELSLPDEKRWFRRTKVMSGRYHIGVRHRMTVAVPRCQWMRYPAQQCSLCGSGRLTEADLSAACMAKWSSDGTRFTCNRFCKARAAAMRRSPVPRGKSLPDLPVQGSLEEDSAALPGSKVIEMSVSIEPLRI